uniref:tRNA-dihydrouridine(16/17) synthase [NAD(P)(+)] n=1 Tax=Bicosoecida sp. CB-2014 TaxID=1486930 RepID=A0A7S1C2D7_9STRA
MEAKRPTGYEFWRSIGSPRRVVAPMVHQSELAFRQLTRRYGAELCYTPMLSSNAFMRSKKYRRANMQTCEGDRPLIVQFAGHDAATLIDAARHVEGMCDAVDLNLGCPQNIAKRGRFGSFLLEEKDVVLDIVRKMVAALTVPVTVKIRMLPSLEETIEYCKELEAAGASMLCVHGRTKEQKGQNVGRCDWDGIKAIKLALGIPIVANGGIGCNADVQRCLDYTGCDGVMSSEAVLENPALFCDNIDPVTGEFVSRDRLLREYMELVEEFPPYTTKVVRAHIFKFMYTECDVFNELRDGLVLPKQTTAGMAKLALDIAAKARAIAAAAADEYADVVLTVPEARPSAAVAGGGAGGADSADGAAAAAPEADDGGAASERRSRDGETAGTHVFAGSSAMGIEAIPEDTERTDARRLAFRVDPTSIPHRSSHEGGLSSGNAWYMRHRAARPTEARVALLAVAQKLGYKPTTPRKVKAGRGVSTSAGEGDDAPGEGGECAAMAEADAAAADSDGRDSAAEAEAAAAATTVEGAAGLFAEEGDDDGW